ncbi:MAG: recombinase family protein, partial [Sedimenticola sp.]
QSLDAGRVVRGSKFDANYGDRWVSFGCNSTACEAYINSQTHEGWLLIDTHYNDGGFSGGNMNRPALTRLMHDIQAGTIDLIVVYKVDRLSRSLADFSKMIETFDQYGVSFVSITQHFNTSTSMGRLTLNVLLSFAQFEREVTGERIRDKIAASKKKGMWMGGIVPLGYDNRDRTLVVNETEAALVSHIYRRYLKLGSVKLLKEELDNQGIRSKRRRNGAGSQPFSRGALYTLLKNPLYIGQLRHKKALYRGTHTPIIDKELWKAVQEKLLEKQRANDLRATAKEPSLLAGLLYDEAGHPFSPTHTRKKSRRYRYYVSQAAVQFKKPASDVLLRVPAQTVETLVEMEVCKLLDNQTRLLRILAPLALEAMDQQTLLHKATQLSETWEALDIQQKIHHLSGITEKITLSRMLISISVSLPGITRILLQHDKYQENEIHELRIPVTLRRCGVETKLLVEQSGSGDHLKPHADSHRAIQEALKKALRWNNALLSGEMQSTREIAEKNGVTQRYVAHLIKLAYLSPTLVNRIYRGDIPHHMTLGKLKRHLPMDWSEQEALFS